MKNNKKILVILLIVTVLGLTIALCGCKSKQFTLSFDTAGFELELEPMTISQGESPTLPTPQLQEPYTFIGWYRDADWSETFDGVITADTTLYLAYSINQVDTKKEIVFITLDAKRNNLGSKRYAINKGDVFEAPNTDNFVIKGYSLSWYSDKELTKPYEFGKAVSANISLYPKYTANTYTVSYDLNGGTAIAVPEAIKTDVVVDAVSKEYQITQSVFLVNVAKTGYHFKGFYQNADFTGDMFIGEVNFAKIANFENLVFYAKYEPISYTLTFKINFYETTDAFEVPNTPTTVQYTIDTPTFALPTAIREGYEFLGWTYKVNNSEEEQLITSVEQGSYGDKELRPKFSQITQD